MILNEKCVVEQILLLYFYEMVIPGAMTMEI